MAINLILQKKWKVILELENIKYLHYGTNIIDIYT